MFGFLLSSFFLQWWGGSFYILNKAFFAFTERTSDFWHKYWKVNAWAVYLIGLPAWLWVFWLNSNFIAVAVEAAGGISMALGLWNASSGLYEKYPAQKRRLRWIAIGATAVGLGASFYGFGGIYLETQWLEIGLAIGFLGGTFLLADDENPIGYLLFMLMLASNARLQWLQGYNGLMVQQIASMPFVVDAYITKQWSWSSVFSYIFRTI